MARWYPFGLFAIAAVAVSFLGSWIVVSSFGGTEGIVPAVIAAVPALVSAVAAVMAAVAALRAARPEDGAKDAPTFPPYPMPAWPNPLNRWKPSCGSPDTGSKRVSGLSLLRNW